MNTINWDYCFPHPPASFDGPRERNGCNWYFPTDQFENRCTKTEQATHMFFSNLPKRRLSDFCLVFQCADHRKSGFIVPTYKNAKKRFRSCTIQPTARMNREENLVPILFDFSCDAHASKQTEIDIHLHWCSLPGIFRRV